ncbi:hypothetical protein HK405_008770 [Cladochytrium tenue]|nr:hypothetical protein HK405_008770 [Cladochytrium tenue]
MNDIFDTADEDEEVEILEKAAAVRDFQPKPSWLVKATTRGHLKTSRLLTALGVSVNARGDSYVRENTALHMAALNGHANVVTLLIDLEADLNAVNLDGNTPLHLASEVGATDVVAQLLAGGAAVDSRNRSQATPIHLAAANGNLVSVARLLDAGAQCSPTDTDGCTPLHFAAANGHTNVANLLVQSGADANIQTVLGNLPVHLAAGNGHEAVTQMLVAESRMDMPNCDGLLPLDVALKNGRFAVVNLLLEAGVDPAPLVRARTTAFHVAVLAASLPTLQRLLESAGPAATVAANLPDGSGRRPIHLAAERGDLEATRLLLARGGASASEPGEAATACYSPLYLAAVAGHLAVVRELLDHGVELNERDGRQRRVLGVIRRAREL